jgi:protein ImuB
MCVYLPAWPLQRLLHDQAELRGKAVVLFRAGRAPQITVCSRRAAAAGVRPGMPVAEARAVLPELDIREEDPEADVRALRRLAQWAERYSPLVGLEDEPAPQSLLLDITGCAACFHGEDNLLRRAVREITEAGWVPRLAIANSIGAAWALAHHGRTPCLTPPGVAATALADLPLAALRLPAKTLEDLAQVGIARIGVLLDLPRSDIPVRFGAAVLQRIDQALGRQPEILVPSRTPGEIEASWSFEYPTDRWQVLNYVLDRLTERIHPPLQQQNLAVRKLENWFYHISKPPLRIEVGLYKPSNCPQYLAMLLHARLERERIEEPVRAVRLRVADAAALTDHQPEFFGQGESHGLEGASALVDCLSGCLGARAVTRARLVEDFQPEYACRFEPLIQPEMPRQGTPPRRPGKAQRRQQKDRWSASPPGQLLRPLQLWSRPVPIEVMSVVPDGPPFRLRWAGEEQRIVRAWGPERIATGWWRGQDVQRDYYVVATDRGTRLWIFRCRADGRWYLHGCFD